MFIFAPRNGYLPVRLRISDDSQAVRWLDFGSVPLRDPFFLDTVEKLRRSVPPPQESFSDLAGLVELGRTKPGTVPAGLIFHISRCGSTLISNCLKIAEGVTVVSEASPITVALSANRMVESTITASCRESLCTELLCALANVFGNHPSQGNSLVIKFSSWSLLDIRQALCAWPGVPCLIVLRDPVEVIVSQLHSPSSWAEFKSVPIHALNLFDWTISARGIAEMGLEEYYARIVGQLCSCAIQAMSKRSYVVNYEDLTLSKIIQIGELFGIDLKGKTEALRKVLCSYSKDKTGQRPFIGDREAKRGAASRAIVGFAEKHARSAYEQLEALPKI